MDFNAAAVTDYYQPTVPNGTSCTITRFDITQIVGMAESNSQAESTFSVFPNPAGDFVTLQLDAPPQKGTIIRIVDIAGREVTQQQVDPMKQTYSLDIANLSNGMYFVEVVGANGTISQKFIKNK